MKKTLLVIALAVVLVLAFATTAMAMGSIPNRSSAFLTTIPTPGVMTGGDNAANRAYYDQIRALSAGGTKAAYITWGQAKDSMVTTLGNTYTAAQLAGPHGNYTTTTIKCQVCHSIHKASINGTMLLPGTNGCIACHGSTTTLTTVKVAAGSSLDNRHGGLTACNSYLCHTESPHGVDISVYPAGASVLLSDWSDFLTAAALQSGINNAPVTATKTNVNMDGYFFDSLSVEVNQPALDGTDVTAVNTPGDARGIAIQTGYTCANEGCHMNGSFNGLSEDAYLGNYVLTLAGQSATLYGFDSTTGKTKSQAYINAQMPLPDYDIANGIYGTQDLRTSAIKGHELYSAFNPAVADNPLTKDVDESAPQLAWANSSTCRNCHDMVDPRFAGKSFPHSNTSWRAWVAGDGNPTHQNGVNGNLAETLSNYGWTARYNTAAWFTLADFQGGTSVESNTRQTIGYTASYAPRTIAMDGACLKCHKGSATTGVGSTF